MFWWLYNVLFVIGFTLLLPRYLWRMWRRGGYAKGFLERFGRYDAATCTKLRARPRLWIHAVSVGEVYVALRFMSVYRETHADVAFALTTNTSTGHRIAAARLHAEDVLLYFPVDLPVFVNRVLNQINPQALILTECELWPNLVRLADKRGVPIALLNGRVSDRSYHGYAFLGRLFRNLLQRFAVVLVQSERDAERMRALGAPPERMHTLGTAKYDVATKDTSKIELMRRILDAAGIPVDAPLIVAGSTWSGEECALVTAFEALRPEVPGLRLVLVPRHFERAAEVEKMLLSMNVTFVKRTALVLGTPCANPVDVLLLDSTGELVGAYAHASVIFVGKSLTNHGGQNIIEPALFGKPVLFGPHMENFPTVVVDFLRADAAVQVADQSELEAAMRALFTDPNRCAAIGARATQVVAEQRGCLERSVALIDAVRGQPALELR